MVGVASVGGANIDEEGPGCVDSEGVIELDKSVVKRNVDEIAFSFIISMEALWEGEIDDVLAVVAAVMLEEVRSGDTENDALTDGENVELWDIIPDEDDVDGDAVRDGVSGEDAVWEIVDDVLMSEKDAEVSTEDDDGASTDALNDKVEKVEDEVEDVPNETVDVMPVEVVISGDDKEDTVALDVTSKEMDVESDAVDDTNVLVENVKSGDAEVLGETEDVNTSKLDEDITSDVDWVATVVNNISVDDVRSGRDWLNDTVAGDDWEDDELDEAFGGPSLEDVRTGGAEEDIEVLEDVISKDSDVDSDIVDVVVNVSKEDATSSDAEALDEVDDTKVTMLDEEADEISGVADVVKISFVDVRSSDSEVEKVSMTGVFVWDIDKVVKNNDSTRKRDTDDELLLEVENETDSELVITRLEDAVSEKVALNDVEEGVTVLSNFSQRDWRYRHCSLECSKVVHSTFSRIGQTIFKGTVWGQSAL